LDFGFSRIKTLSLFDNYTLVCGNRITSNSANMRWGIINETNTVTIKCTLDLVSGDLDVYQTHLIDNTTYLILFEGFIRSTSSRNTLIKYNSCI